MTNIPKLSIMDQTSLSDLDLDLEGGRSNVFFFFFFNLKGIVVMSIKTKYNTISQNILDQKRLT